MSISENHSANVSRAQAKLAIEMKKSLLKTWMDTGVPWVATTNGEQVRDSIGELKLDYFPTCIAEFCRWNGTQNCESVRSTLGSITITNRSTLDTHPGLKSEIDALCKALVKQAARQLGETNKSTQIEELKEKVIFLNSVITRQETEITQLQIGEDSLKGKLSRSERALTNSAKHYDDAIAELKKQVAELTASLRKVVPLKIES